MSIVVHNGNWGMWKLSSKGSTNFFVCGAEVRYEKNDGSGSGVTGPVDPKFDKTGLNGIKFLMCDSKVKSKFPI